MTLHKWDIINADKEPIEQVITANKNRHAAVEKAYHKMGAKLTFCKVEYAGIHEDNRSPNQTGGQKNEHKR